MMRKNYIVMGLIGLVLGSFLTIFFVSKNNNTVNNGFMGMMGGNAGKQSAQFSNNVDRHFIEEMIPHHEGAIDMAKLALERSTKPEIKSLAQSIISSQSDEITQMKNWYKQWYGTDVPQDENRAMGMGRGMMHGGMMGDESDLSSLEKAENFDKAFIDEMIPHHQMAVTMSEMLLTSTDRTEMKELGKNIISAQNKEIAEMRVWYSSWGF